MVNDIAGHEDLTDKIIECGIRVHEHFGPGLLESVYKACLALELREADLKVDTTRRVALVYLFKQVLPFSRSPVRSWEWPSAQETQRAWSIGNSLPPHARTDVHGSAGADQNGSVAGRPSGSRPTEQRYRLPVEM
jgi:hypothetical protein